MHSGRETAFLPLGRRPRGPGRSLSSGRELVVAAARPPDSRARHEARPKPRYARAASPQLTCVHNERQ